jgi:predicted O-linked N-acetylglucosamine transferase (SPINDLY family)
MYVPDTAICGENLRREAARLGVEPDRIVFAARVPMADHVARISLADLSLDPFHISGGATSVATLAADVPLLTLRGDSYLARMGSSINSSLGMDDLDCGEPDQYIANAVELATTPGRLDAVRNELAKALQNSHFFDTRSFVSSLEEALQSAWDRHKAGLPAADISVPASSPRS